MWNKALFSDFHVIIHTYFQRVFFFFSWPPNLKQFTPPGVTFCKEPNCKYFRICRPCGPRCYHWPLPLPHGIRHRSACTKEQGCEPMPLFTDTEIWPSYNFHVSQIIILPLILFSTIENIKKKKTNPPFSSRTMQNQAEGPVWPVDYDLTLYSISLLYSVCCLHHLLCKIIYLCIYIVSILSCARSEISPCEAGMLSDLSPLSTAPQTLNKYVLHV